MLSYPFAKSKRLYLCPEKAGRRFSMTTEQNRLNPLGLFKPHDRQQIRSTDLNGMAQMNGKNEEDDAENSESLPRPRRAKSAVNGLV